MSSETEEVIEQRFTPPKGAQVIKDDVDGYWQPSHGPISFVPESIRLMDNSSRNEDAADKSSALIIGELLEEAQVIDANKRPITLEAGSAIGIWAKAGMRLLLDKQGCQVWMAPHGKREMGAGRQAMQLFQVALLEGSKPSGTNLALLEDTRNRSLIEPVNVAASGDGNRKPPWWLGVLPDGGMDRAVEEEKKRSVERQQRLATLESASAN